MPQRAEHRIDDLRRIEARFIVLLVGRIVVLENIGQAHGADLQAVVEQAGIACMGQDMRADPTDGGFLDGHHDLMRAHQAVDQIGVEWFCEAQIRNGGGQAFGLQLIRGLLRFGKTRAERQDRDLAAFANHAALADLQQFRRFG